MESPIRPEKLIHSEPKLKHINKVLELLRPERGPLGEEINWKELYKEVKPWSSGIELSDNIRQVVYGYVALKIPSFKDAIPSIDDLRNNDLANAIVHNWSDDILEKVGGQRREILMTVAAQVVKRIETLIYKKIFTEAVDADLEDKLGVNPKLRHLLINLLDASQRADPLFVRFQAFAQLSTKPPQEATSSTMFLPDDDTPYTIASLFPHETQSISKNLTYLSENASEWEDLPGADAFKRYLSVLGAIYDEKDPKQAEQYLAESEKLYEELLSSEFPVIVSSGMIESSYFKEPYIDPELKISISTPEAREEEVAWKTAQKGMADSLYGTDLWPFAEEMNNRVIRSVVNIGGHGANLVFNAVADEEPGIVVFLNEQLRSYDRNFPGFMGVVKNRDEIFGDISDPETRLLMEQMSRSNSVHHELAHAIFKSSLPESKRLGREPLTAIDEIKAETMYRSLVPKMIESATLPGNEKQWAMSMLTTSLQMLRDQDPSSDYYTAAVYTLNDLFESEVVKFENGQVEVLDFDNFYKINSKLKEEILNLYRDESMTEDKAEKWLKQRCRPNAKVKELSDFLKNDLVSLKDELVGMGISKLGRLEALIALDSETFRGILTVDHASFPMEMNPSPEELEKMWRNSDNIRIVLKNIEDGSVIGNVLAVLPESELDILKLGDPDFSPQEGDIYGESIAVLPGLQKRLVGSYLLDKLFEEAKRKGFQRILIHSRRSTSSPLIKEKYKVEPVRTIENWQGWKEPFDYYEIPIV